MLIENNKLITIALKDIHPFNVDAGIFCGSYPGPLYPQPTTLVANGLGIDFDPYLYQKIPPNRYKMDSDYTGLGIGNPGINYRNPGHLLGLMDTFARMSYGLNIIKKTRLFVPSSNIDPIINFQLPTLDLRGNLSPISISNIYPFYTEIPSAYIDNISINTSTGRLDPIYSIGNPYTPLVSDGETALELFSDKVILSYQTIPQFFMDLISYFYSVAQEFSQETSANFQFLNAHNFINYAPIPGQASPVLYDTGEGGDLVATEAIIIPSLQVKHKCEVLDPLKALQIFDGDTEYRRGRSSVLHEYRSLTQLNSVVNLVPVQTVASRLETEIKHSIGVSVGGNPIEYFVTDNTDRSFSHVSFIISEFILNISLAKPSTISIGSFYNMQTPISNVNNYTTILRSQVRTELPLLGACTLVETSFDPMHRFTKTINVTYSLTNKFSWDRSWFGLPQTSETYNETDSFSSGGIISLADLSPDPLSGNFNKTINIPAGHHILRIKHVLQNNYLIGSSNPPGGIQPLYDLPDLTECNVAAGVQDRSFRFVGIDPVVPILVPEAINLTYNITGDFPTINHSISI